MVHVSARKFQPASENPYGIASSVESAGCDAVVPEKHHNSVFLLSLLDALVLATITLLSWTLCEFPPSKCYFIALDHAYQHRFRIRSINTRHIGHNEYELIHVGNVYIRRIRHFRRNSPHQADLIWHVQLHVLRRLVQWHCDVRRLGCLCAPDRSPGTHATDAPLSQPAGRDQHPRRISAPHIYRTRNHHRARCQATVAQFESSSGALTTDRLGRVRVHAGVEIPKSG